MDAEFLKHTVIDANRCYMAGMDAQRSVSPAIGEFAVQENAILRTAILGILLAYDSVKDYENVSIPVPLANAIEAARRAVK